MNKKIFFGQIGCLGGFLWFIPVLTISFLLLFNVVVIGLDAFCALLGWYGINPLTQYLWGNIFLQAHIIGYLVLVIISGIIMSGISYIFFNYFTDDIYPY